VVKAGDPASSGLVRTNGCWVADFNLYAEVRSCFLREMRRLTAFIIIGWAWAVVALPVSALTWEKSGLDLAVEAGAGEVVAEFPFKNEGTAAVTIRELKASCGCTTPTVESRVVPAGGSGVIKATYATGDRSGPQSVRITVVTNEPGSEPVVLPLRVDIQPLVSITPRLVHWSQADGLVARVIELKRTAKSAVRLGEPKPQADTLTVALTPGAEPDTWRLTLTPKSVDAPFTTKIEIPVITGERTITYSVFAVSR